MTESTILQQIVAHKHEEVAAAEAIVSFGELEANFPEPGQARPFEVVICERAQQQQVAVIAEIKKASPSKGLIREDFHPALHAQDYESNGATCLSILTDEKYFQGCNDYLVQARKACTIPVLRKDFMVDTYQLAESKVLGADCILLIVAALEQSQLLELEAYARDISLDILVEVHNQEELERALDLKTDLIGINNRNLHTFETNLQTTLDLALLVPKEKTVITESGIHTAEDVNTMVSNGIYSFLVGEAFMRAPSPGEKLKELMFAGSNV
ncbi:MAG: indole-3-glycerol-phosphate synthase [SAR86 cluster bacterium]|uniref:Indole-3-glycerol phosphate synthase n=1 Tax=SAR86 cluster bacterium TaxID=2030880 RepID=A0A2A5AV19_9GAMM|nr:MAG: indole-3-glycerol-phosphate synthase [SAR86 cluster bacterium]